MHIIEKAIQNFIEQPIFSKGITALGFQIDHDGNAKLSSVSTPILTITDDMSGSLPVGIIISVATNIAAAPTIANGWHPCNGSAIPAGNTLVGTAPNISDSRFIRGALASGAVGNTGTHTHTMDSKLGTVTFAHTHPIASHTHTADVHDHSASHEHTLLSHTHTVAAHTHGISGTSLQRLHNHDCYGIDILYDHRGYFHASSTWGVNVPAFEQSGTGSVAVAGTLGNNIRLLSLQGDSDSAAYPTTTSSNATTISGAQLASMSPSGATGNATTAIAAVAATATSSSGLSNINLAHVHTNVAASHEPSFFNTVFYIRVR